LFGRSGADKVPAEPVRAVRADAPATVSMEADEPVAPAPVARGPEPNPVTPAGLTRRTPGAALNGSAPVAEAEHGLFRRLPTAADTNEIDPAERLRTLRAFSRGVDEGRREDTPS
jgi:hypothetical protein